MWLPARRARAPARADRLWCLRDDGLPAVPAPPVVAPVTPEQLVRAGIRILQEYPDAQIVRNRVGNLSVMDGARYAGYVDVNTGEVELWTEQPDREGP